MTMRLDIVTNDAGELVRREHARELGGGVVVAIYRLAKLAQMHDLGNQAFLRQLEQTHQMIGEYCLRSGSNVSVLFADKATFVAGQLLKGNRGAYLAAAELGELLQRLGGSELHIARDVTREECHQFAEQISLFHRTGNASSLRLPARIRLRPVADAARLRGIELEDLTPDQRIVRAYASAVVIMRRFFEDLSASRYVLPRRIKRIAQSLVDLSDSSTASFLGVTEVRNANYDEAGRAVNTAILAVSIARESTQDRATLSQIAMAAMMHDVARPRALALAGAGGAPMPGMAGPTTLSEDQEDGLAAGAAAVLTALGRVNEPSIRRTVLTFEALWLRRRTWLGPVYWGARPPTMHATIIAVARRYNDLLTPEPGLMPPTTDFAVATLANELTDAQERTVLRMLVSALGLLPTGTLVQLSTGEVAEVVRGARRFGDKPRVAIVADAKGARYAQPIEVELSQDPGRTVHRVLGVDGWQKGLEQAHELEGAGPDSDGDVPVSAAPPANLAASEVADQGWGDAAEGEAVDVAGADPASGSLPSFGSTPSAVGAAMGRAIDASRGAATHATSSGEGDRPDRTVFQPRGSNGGTAATPAALTTAREPTAQGSLSATPLPHVLVYMLDHGLTGTVVFEANGDADNDTIYFLHGVPAKIRLVDRVALLGEVLIDEGLLGADAVAAAVQGAQSLGLLLGEYLVGEGVLRRDTLQWALERQLLRKVAHLANLAPEIQYSYYRDVDLLDGWGGEILVSHPLNPTLASVRDWHDRARVRGTLSRIGKHPLALHEEGDLTKLVTTPEEQVVLDAIRSEAMSLPLLVEANLADEETVSSLVYTLAVTRQFGFKGQKKGPMAGPGSAWWSAASADDSSGSMDSRASDPSHPSTPSTSTSRAAPAVVAAAAPMVASGGAVPPRVGRSPISVDMGASDASKVLRPAARGAAPAAARPSGPAARPPVTNAKAGPQIRPITTRKSTIVGIQPGAPPEARPPAVGRDPQRTSSVTPRASEASHDEPSDDAKTLAISSPVRPDLLVKRGAAGAPAPRWTPNLPGGTAKAAPAASNARAAAPSAAGASPRAPGAVGSSSAKVAKAAPEVAGQGMSEAEAALEAMTSFRLAEGALQRNDRTSAEEHARRAVAGDPTQPDYIALLAWIRSQGATPDVLEESIRTMSKVLIEDPSNEKALFYRGKLLVQTNRLPEAMNDFTELLSANPHHREAQTEAQQLKTKLPT